ncbi:RNA-splicing factor [Myotisia sp. PD_48]|nr:RNA-splicing factor [Myotisia sp. PD_48]
MDASSQAAAAPISFKKRSAKAKSGFRKKAPTPPPLADSGSDFTSSDDDEGHRVKRRRKTAIITASSTLAAPNRNEKDIPPTSTVPHTLATTNNATKQSNWYDEENEDDLSAKNLLGNARSRATDLTYVKQGSYQGASNYQSFIQKRTDAPTKQVGPIKAPTNIRTITFTDFAPDVCKDYKMTGFCGFGDTCKFLHEREDYKQGWELDRDWDKQTLGKKQAGRTVASANRELNTGEEDGEEEEDAMLEEIPFACFICKEPYRDPIQTKCGHYFCEACALKRYRKNPNCAACGTQTSGVFNTAKKLAKLLDRKRERARKRREKAIENGEEVSDEEEEPEEAS